jgi:hypothetical protein
MPTIAWVANESLTGDDVTKPISGIRDGVQLKRPAINRIHRPQQAVNSVVRANDRWHRTSLGRGSTYASTRRPGFITTVRTNRLTWSQSAVRTATTCGRATDPPGRLPTPEVAAHGAADRRPPAPVLAACSRSAADRKQRGPTNGTVALPTRSTVGQGYLVSVGDSDLLAADASTLRFGILRRWV